MLSTFKSFADRFVGNLEGVVDGGVSDGASNAAISKGGNGREDDVRGPASSPPSSGKGSVSSRSLLANISPLPSPYEFRAFLKKVTNLDGMQQEQSGTKSFANAKPPPHRQVMPSPTRSLPSPSPPPSDFDVPEVVRSENLLSKHEMEELKTFSSGASSPPAASLFSGNSNSGRYDCQNSDNSPVSKVSNAENASQASPAEVARKIVEIGVDFGVLIRENCCRGGIERIVRRANPKTLILIVIGFVLICAIIVFVWGMLHGEDDAVHYIALRKQTHH